MSIKTLLEKAMLRLGSHGGMPSTSVITLVNRRDTSEPSGAQTFTYVAPCDGELNAFLQANPASDTSNNWAGCEIVGDNGVRHATRTTDGSVHLFVRKGENAISRFYNANHQISQWIVQFVKTVGGGKILYYQLLKRGAVWLRLSLWLMPSLPHGGVAISRFPKQRGSRKTLRLREGMRIESGSSPRQTTDFSWLKQAFRVLILPGGVGMMLTYHQPVGAVPTVTSPASATRWLKATRLRLSQAVQTTHLLRFICVSTPTLAPSFSSEVRYDFA